MYVPIKHAWNEVQAMHEHIHHHPLGAWVCAGDEGFHAHHIPFVLDSSFGVCGTLLGHVARGNTVWKALENGAPCVVMFMGPQAYITPAWYLGRKSHGKVVPTWNYVTVHAHGVARAVDDAEWKLNMLTRLTDSQEATRQDPWRVNEVPSETLHKLLSGIVGIEITIDRLEGKCKASEDEDLADREGTVIGLQLEATSTSQEMARWVQDAMPKP